MNYRTADIKDLNLLVKERLDFIKINEKDIRYETVYNNCCQYFEKAIKEDMCDIILAEEEGECIGTGIIFYYLSVPSAFNMAGKNAYITSMYVKAEYRRGGIGTTILKELIHKAAQKGYEIIMLSASDMGRPLYYKMGFIESKNGMILDNRKLKNTLQV
ncbi:putative N-acetyltransferase YhbS [Anaerotaenia torta]|uniref:GNAT family N-acetyltransferase n=1 Tax=Anaerotaenia torta TaxID=433293 RepID=UPI003D21D87B